MIRLLSLGAGVQSTTLALMVCEGRLDRLDGAIFADTGWEPRRVYDHLARLEAALAEAGVPLHRVSAGNLRDDLVNADRRFAGIPYYILAPADMTVAEAVEWEPCGTCGAGPTVPCTGDAGCEPRPPTRHVDRPATRSEREGMGRRQCTKEYKLGPINRKVRELLGASPPDFRTVPRGRTAEQWIGFSADEIGRVNDGRSPGYVRPRYPLIDLGMDRKACERWLTSRGWVGVSKSACIGCPYTTNAGWREMRDQRPDDWADVVDLDERIRKGGARGANLRGEAFLHRSRIPLAIAPVNRTTRGERLGWQTDIFDHLADQEEVQHSCSPHGCASEGGPEDDPP